MPTGLGDEQLWISATNDNTGTSTAFNDQSGQGNNGTAVGALVVADANNGGTYAFDFNGTSDYINCGNAFNPSASFSISFWVLNDTTNKSMYVSKNWDGTSEPYISRFNGGAGTLQFYTYQGSIKGTLISNPFTVSSWSCVTNVYNGTHWEIYIDGVLASQTAQTQSAYNNASDLWIGDTSGASGWNHDGRMDDIRMYDRALTQAEITHLASSRGVEGPPPVGLGDEQMWFCPSLMSNGNDITGSATGETLVGAMAIVSDTQSGGSLAYDTPNGLNGGLSFTPPATTISSGQAASITVSMWADHTSFNTSYLFSLGANSFNDYLNIQGLSNDFIRGNVQGGIVGNNVQFTRSSPMQHYVFEFTATTIKVYLNGTLVDTAIGTWSGDTWDRGGIGLLARSVSTNGTQCTLDDIRVYGRTLTGAEVTHLATSRGIEGSPSTPTTQYNAFITHAFKQLFQTRLR